MSLSLLIIQAGLSLVAASCFFGANESGGDDDKPVYQTEHPYTCSVAWECPNTDYGSNVAYKIYGQYIYFVNGSTYFNNPRSLWKVDLDTGEKVWESREIQGMIVGIARVNNTTYLFGENNGYNILSFDDNNGELTATILFDEDEEVASHINVWMGKPIEYGNSLVWGSGVGLCKLDVGRIDYDKPVNEVQVIIPECLFDVPKYCGIAATPVIEDDVVYFMRNAYMDEPGENDIAAYNLATDTLVWQRKSNLMTGLVLDGMRVYGDWLCIVDAFGATCIHKATGGKDATTGDGERWVINEDSDVSYMEIFAADCYGRGLFVSNNKMFYTNGIHSDSDSFIDVPAAKLKNIICLDITTGKPVWTDMPPYFCGSLGASPIVANGKAYVAHDDGLRVYNAETGELLGVDRSITPSGRFSWNTYYAEKGYVIIQSINDDGNATLKAIRAE